MEQKANAPKAQEERKQLTEKPVAHPRAGMPVLLAIVALYVLAAIGVILTGSSLDAGTGGFWPFPSSRCASSSSFSPGFPCAG